jgi:hypothetical protein
MDNAQKLILELQSKLKFYEESKEDDVQMECSKSQDATSQAL